LMCCCCWCCAAAAGCVGLQLFSRTSLGQDDAAWGANAELRTDARQLVGSRYPSPVSLSGSVMGQRGEAIAAVSAAVQLQQGRRSAVGGKVQLNNRGAATVGLQVRSDGCQWLGLLGMVPLVNLGVGVLMNKFGNHGRNSSSSVDGGGRTAWHAAAKAAEVEAAAALRQQQMVLAE